ncbi:RNA polymerase III subunit Rpc25 [Catenaria anguillulae PL171]|uniref:RNA polymerase III subunit Rpc25 n=1 Tax=Catenaria anguillulae PL171 TaxID=765915 RepID=A0A1Y2I4F4_9FUNG|nr:RNA polymerase III subunit Rpc25 [Catenaria anguillulae PL171]
MFVLAEFKDTIRVMPEDLRKPREKAIEDEVNAKYANKVFHNVGLCVCLHELLHVADGIVQHTEGSAYYKVRFTMVVFRPFPGEVLVGEIKSSSRDGVRVSTTFFDDILIPPTFLPTPKSFDEVEQVWVWEYEGQKLYLDANETVRVQVQSVEFKEIRPDAAKRGDGKLAAPPAPAQQQPQTSLLGNVAETSQPQEDLAVVEVPFKVIGDMSGQGLGPLSWWPDDDQYE